MLPRKKAAKEHGEMEKGKIIMKKNFSIVVFVELCFWYKNIYIK